VDFQVKQHLPQTLERLLERPELLIIKKYPEMIIRMAFHSLIIICDHYKFFIIKRYRKLIIRISQNASLVAISQVGLLEEYEVSSANTMREVIKPMWET